MQCQNFEINILKTCTRSPIFNQLTSGILHIVLHLIIHNFERSFDIIWYIDNFISQQRVVKIYFSSDFFVIVRHILIFNIFISIFLHCVLYLMKY